MNGARSEAATDCGWEIVAPERLSAGIPLSKVTAEFLAELSEFRGRILYANGRRPGFVREGGGYADEDPLDADSFHVTVRAAGALIGCARVTPMPEYGRSFIGRRFGPSCLASVVQLMKLARTDCAEVGRWIMAPPWRRREVGYLLLLSMWVVGRWLDKRCLFGAVGGRDGQSNMVLRSGGHLAPGIHPLFVSALDDELSVMYFDLCHPPPKIDAPLWRVRRMLQLPERGDTTRLECVARSSA